MYAQHRIKQCSAEDWALILGADDPSTLSKRRRKTFLSHIQTSDPRWNEISVRLSVGDKVLDVGCGMGQWVRFLNEQGMVATGLDYSEEMISLLKQHMPNCTWLHGPMQEMPLADGSQDAVISWGVVEHDEAGPSAALTEFYRVLRPGGYVFLTVPIDTPNFRASSVLHFGEPGPGKAFFEYCFTPAEFSQLAANAGFQVEQSDPCTKSCSMVYPRVYRWASTRGKHVSWFVRRAFTALAGRREDAYSRVFLIGRKP